MGRSRAAGSAIRARAGAGTKPISCSSAWLDHQQPRAAPASIRGISPRRAAMPVIAIYGRVSTPRQAQSQSTEQQLERLRAYVLAQNWDLAPEYIFRDDGYSGGILQRPGLDRLRDAVASARIDRILITAPDRLARNWPWCTDQGCGRNDPDPVLGSCDAGGLRASQLQHAVQDLDRHVHLSRLTLIRTRAQPVPDHALEPADGGLGPGARIVARG